MCITVLHHKHISGSTCAPVTLLDLRGCRRLENKAITGHISLFDGVPQYWTEVHQNL